jgi:integrase
VRGRQHRESAGRTKLEARRKLRSRLKEIYGDRFVGPKEERLTVGELLDGLVLHLETRGAKAMASLKSHVAPVRESFGLERAIDITTTRVEAYMVQRLAAKKARATVNREVGALKQAFNLARKQGRLARVPYLPLLKEDNARQGFFEPKEFESVARQLASPLDDVARFAYLTGWRKGEIVGLGWDAVDRDAKEVLLRTSKNGRGRVLPLSGEVADLIERRWTAREFRVDKGPTQLASVVFHKAGVPVGDFRKAWASACKKAGVPGRLFHDLRRTAIRNMIRSGVAERVAMEISGHRTRAVFDRYNIVSDADKREALLKTQEHMAAVRTGVVVPMPVRSAS